MLRKLRQYEMSEDLGGIGHWYWAVDQDIVEWSAKTFELHHLEPVPGLIDFERMVGNYHTDDRDPFEAALRTAAESGQGFSHEMRLVAIGSEERYLRIEGRCELSEGDYPIAMFGVFRDITKAREDNRRMQALKARQADFIEISTDWVWEMGPDLRFTYMSAQVEEITGVPVAFHIGKTRQELYGDQEIPIEMEMHLAWLEQHQPFKDFRFWRQGPDGSRQYISSSGKPFFDENGAFAGYRGVGRDLTAFERAKEELVATNRKLNVANKAKSDAMGRLKTANAQLEERNSEMQLVQQEIEHRSLHDPLTGIANRRFLDHRLQEMAEHCRVSGAWLGALHIDLDRFKHINDTLGHAAGDAVLKHVANVLQTSVPAGDFCARVGGDEFVVVCTGHVGEEMLGSLAKRLIDEFSRPIRFEGRDCWVGASVGIATMRGDEIVAQQLLVNADVALYRAKREGRGCYTYFTEALQREIINYKKVADGILLGLKQDEFVPWFQPQVSARTLEITGIEALARWRCGDGRVRSPAEFLAIAEDLSAVAAIDRKILEYVVAYTEAWRGEGLLVPKVSVNVSAKRLMDAALIDSLRAMDLPAGMISFELLESVFMDNVDDQIGWNIDALREMGIEVELDDFGSGHASLISLVNLGPDAIKIDRQLIAAMTMDHARLNLVRSIVEIGRSLDVRVIAEGVETAREATLLREMACDDLQGYLIAKPMPADKLTEFIGNWSPEAFMSEQGLTGDVWAA
ncbi:MAG: EAL domain-containing protein [Pseudomonadota bacterium]